MFICWEHNPLRSDLWISGLEHLFKTTVYLTCGLLHLSYKACLPLVFLSLDQGRGLTRWIIAISWTSWRCLIWISSYLVLPGSMCCCRVLGEGGSWARLLTSHVPGLPFAWPTLISSPWSPSFASYVGSWGCCCSLSWTNRLSCWFELAASYGASWQAPSFANPDGCDLRGFPRGISYILIFCQDLIVLRRNHNSSGHKVSGCPSRDPVAQLSCLTTGRWRSTGEVGGNPGVRCRNGRHLDYSWETK